jgi:two-component system LytT family sensor kinase
MKYTPFFNLLPRSELSSSGRSLGLAFGRPGTHPGAMRLRLAVLAFMVWTAVGVFQAVPEMLRGFYWPVLASKLIDVWTWALFTPAILLIDRKLTSGRQSFASLAAVHLLLSLPITLSHTLVTAILHYPIEEMWWSPLRTPEYTKYYFIGGWMTYCAFIGIVQAFKFYQRLATSQLALERAEKRLLASHLNALRLQLEPHFLFNALNAISSEVATNPEVSREMIEDLATLLRRSLDSQGTEITLAEELTLLDHYLSIQKKRFGERVAVTIDADPAVLSAMVPSMLLQPLVENAIRHGVEGRLSGGTIAVSTQRAGDMLQIRVIDDGVGLPGDWRMDKCGGHGVRVTRERLEALYPQAGEEAFRISRRSAGGTEVFIRIPLNRIGVTGG